MLQACNWKEKASKMRIVTSHSGIELAHLRVVTYTGLTILKLIVGEAKGKLIIVYDLYRILPHSFNKYSVWAFPY